MARVFVSIGSNIDRAASVRSGVAALRQAFGPVALSSVYESEAVGFVGDPFYNLVAAFDTDVPVAAVADTLRCIEDAHGRDRSGPRFSSRSLDLDLLLYDDLVQDSDGLELPRAEITENAFVLWPLAELAPDLRHPVTGETFGRIWACFDKSRQPLWPVPFDWAA